MNKCFALVLVLATACVGSAAAVTDCTGARATPARLEAEALERTYGRQAPSSDRALTALRLARSLVRLNKLERAESLLLEAQTSLLDPRVRVAASLELGNVRWLRKNAAGAESAWVEALQQSSPPDDDVRIAVELNRLRDITVPYRLERLEQLATRLEAVVASASAGTHRRLWLNLASQASDSETTRALAERAYRRAAELAETAVDAGSAIEAHDGLARLQEQAGNRDAALWHALEALRWGQRQPYRDLLIGVEARVGRLSLAMGDEPRATAAFRRAVSHVDAVRADIPVVYEDGRSSFRETMSPIYLGLTDALLKQADKAPAGERQALLRLARGAVEQSKQSEMEDYLLDRCTVRGSISRRDFKPPVGTAVLYPVMLKDRLELLLETNSGIERATVAIGSEPLGASIQTFVNALRNRAPFRAQAERLYRSLLGPLQPFIEAQGIQTLVHVPDGALRMLPLGALHNGRQYVISRLNLVTVPSMGLLGSAEQPKGSSSLLLAGLSEPGPVVRLLTREMVDGIGVEPSQSRGLRTVPIRSSTQELQVVDVESQHRELQAALALPGVAAEIDELARSTSSGKPLLNETFTIEGLHQALLSGDQTVLHIASHGLFGDSAAKTFVMAYDGLITLDMLQTLLSSDRFKRRPLDLITLSACQTAEGDDRAPLGMSGAAIKARARSALGTLWPVFDAAALDVMTNFYRLLAAGQSKAAALRQAQADLLNKPGFQHPYYWAPFTLVGDWQ